MENVLLAIELLKDYHRDAVSPRCAMKIDISKALHLPEKFIHWIRLCITTASFSVQVNGEFAGFFRSQGAFDKVALFLLIYLSYV